MLKAPSKGAPKEPFPGWLTLPLASAECNGAVCGPRPEALGVGCALSTGPAVKARVSLRPTCVQRKGLSNAPLSQFSGPAVSPSPLLRPLKRTHGVRLPRALFPRRPSHHCVLPSSDFSEGCPAVCPAASRALGRLRHDRNAQEDAGRGREGKDAVHGGDPGRAGLAWALVGAALSPARAPRPDTRSPASGPPVVAIPSRAGWGAQLPALGGPEDRETEREKSLRRAPGRQGPPRLPSRLVQSPTCGSGAAREEAPGGARRGRALGARPRSRLRGFPWPQQRGLCGGGGGAASQTSSFPGRPAAPVPREAGGRRTRPGLDVDYRAARDGKRLIKPRPAGPSHSPPRRPERGPHAASWSAGPTPDDPGPGRTADDCCPGRAPDYPGHGRSSSAGAATRRSFFEIRTEWSDRSVLYLHRSLADLGRLWQRLRDAFPEDRSELARGPLRQGLVAIKEAHDIETRLNEVEKLLKTIISMPCKYSRSEVVLTFFERSPLDQVLKNDNVHKIQPSFQSPVKISEIMRSNGFCLANTETIVIDHSIPNGRDQHLGMDPAEHLFENGSEFPSELEDGDDPAAYVTNLSYYHLVPFETDILD
ncbi:hypothetical protein H8959_010801 [Pygathrix nigripes]